MTASGSGQGEERAQPTRQVRGLAPGTKAGLGVAALLVVWAIMTLYWPASAPGAAGATVVCGSAASPAAGDQCVIETGRLRLQAIALIGGAIVIAVTAGAVFGTREVREGA